MKIKRTFKAVLICLFVIFMAISLVACEEEPDSVSNPDQSSSSTVEIPVDADYAIEVYAEQLDGSYLKTDFNGNGKVGDPVVITAEALDTLDAIPEGYYFDESDSRNMLTGNISEDEKLTLKVYLKLYEYDVVFKNDDGQVLQSVKVKHGAMPTYNGTPVKAADKTYSYTFSSWDKAIAVCKENATYTAVYTKAYIEYTITFDFANDEPALASTYHYGDDVTVPADPTKEGYTFMGWDKDISDKCQGSETYTAVYAKNVEYTVKHFNRSIYGYVTLIATETKSGHTQTDVESFKKEYDGIVFLGSKLQSTDNVVELYYGLEGTTYNVPDFTASGYDEGVGSYNEKGTITDNDRNVIYNNVYEASVVAGTSSAFLDIAYGNNSGKWLLLPVKQNYKYIGDTLQFVDEVGNYYNRNDYPLWFDQDGNAIAYSDSYENWMTMAIYLDSEFYPVDGSININLFLWRLGTVQIGEYTYLTQEQFNEVFKKTYSTVNHYVRNIDGSFTLTETETNVTCVIVPTAKAYEGHVYSSLNVSGTVCNMYYELAGVTFNSANKISKWKNIESYQVSDGGSMINEGKYRAATKKIETISQSGDGAYLNISDIADKKGQYLVFAIKNSFTAIDPTVPQQNDAGAADLKYFDEAGNAVAYEKNNSESWYIVVVEITEALAARGYIALDFFCWSAGSVIVGDYAFITQGQLNTLLPASQG